MTDYTELANRLRKRGERINKFGSPFFTEANANDMIAAADAIEELAAFKAQITDGHFYCMRNGVLYEAKVEPPKGKVFQLPPIEFAEEK